MAPTPEQGSIVLVCCRAWPFLAFFKSLEAAPRRKCITTTAVRNFAPVYGSPRPYKARQGEFSEDNEAAAIAKRRHDDC